MSDCEICGQYLYINEGWRIAPAQIPGDESDPDTNYRERDGSGYVHKRCLENDEG